MDSKPQLRVAIKCRGQEVELVPYIADLYGKMMAAMLSSLRGVEIKEGDVIKISIEDGS